MNDYKYLKDEQYYIDRYDLLTIKECIQAVKTFQEVYQESLKNEEVKDIPEKEKIKAFNYLLNTRLFALKASEYQNKKELVQKWIDQDRIEQEKYDTTPEPQGILCPHCKSSMFVVTKHLEGFTDKPLRVMFLFRCTACKKQEWVYDNREVRVSKPDLCSKCNKEINVTHKKKGQVITWTRKCKHCGHTETEVDDFEKSHAEYLKKEQEDKELLEKFRAEFCLTDEKGKEYIETLEALDVAHEAYEEEVQKYDSQAYQYAVQLNKISIVDLEKLLSERVGKAKYIKLSFDKPEIGEHVIVPFIVQDADSSRKENIRVAELKKLIDDALEGTNWRLMGDYMSSRLGYISGRLKGYEREEDFFKLSGKQKEPKPSKIDPEKKSKYSYHNLVQLARMSGEFKGVENVRKRRLEKEPEGFFLEPTESSYTCCICREQTPGEKTWWTLDGLRCADCWRNIKEGVIPRLNYENEGIWMQQSDFKSDYSIQPMTRKKLEKDGLIHGRELKRRDGSIYCTIYLIEENQESLKKYPKKPEMDIRLEWSEKNKGLVLFANKIDYSKETSQK